MRVWKSVGAVAVYSRTRAILLVVVAVAVLLGAGVLAGVAIGGGDNTDASGDPTTVTVKASPSSTQAEADAPPPAKASKTELRKATKAGYKRGFKAGSQKQGVFAAGGDIKAGGIYMVRLVNGSNGKLAIAQHVTVHAGDAYYICSGGTRVCIRQGGG
jgi:hypothetical protein